MLDCRVTAGVNVKVRARVRDSWGYETPGYEKVRVRNVRKPILHRWTYALHRFDGVLGGGAINIADSTSLAPRTAAGIILKFQPRRF